MQVDQSTPSREILRVERFFQQVAMTTAINHVEFRILQVDRFFCKERRRACSTLATSRPSIHSTCRPLVVVDSVAQHLKMASYLNDSSFFGDRFGCLPAFIRLVL